MNTDRTMRRSLSSASLLAFSVFALWSTRTAAQPTWRFHLAFEDATGAQDTIWLIWDTAATDGSIDGTVDMLLGEGGIDMNTAEFNVWVYNWAGDSTKTIALPYLYFPVQEVLIQASAFEYPITLRWDTVLFHASFLPDPAAINYARMDCGHFFFYNNDPGLQAFNMLIDDTVQVEMMWPNDALFPLEVQIGHGSTIGVGESPPTSPAFALWPNPADDRIAIQAPGSIRDYHIYNATGALVRYGDAFAQDQLSLNVSDLVVGLYSIMVRSTSNTVHHAQFIKAGR